MLLSATHDHQQMINEFQYMQHKATVQGINQEAV